MKLSRGYYDRCFHPPLALPLPGNAGTGYPKSGIPYNSENALSAVSGSDYVGDGAENQKGPNKSYAYALFTDRFLRGDAELDFVGIMMAILVGKLNAYGSTISTLKMSLDKKFATTDSLNQLIQELTMADTAVKSDAAEQLKYETTDKLKELLGEGYITNKGDTKEPDTYKQGEIVQVTNGGNTEYWTSKANVTAWLNLASSTVTKLQNLGNIDTAGMQTASQSMNTVTDLVSNGLKRIGDAANTPVTNMR